jgi:hypothetical protein
MPGEHLVAHDPEGVEIHPMVDVGLGHGLFRRHILRRADRDPYRGEFVSRRDADGLGHAEVGDRGVAAREHHVVGLDVPVDDAPGVGVGERVGDLLEQPHGLVDGKLSHAVEPRPQRFALYERHDVVEEPLGRPGIVERENVGVLHLGDDMDLAGEPVGSHRGGQLGAEDLEGDVAVVLEVVRQVHGGHAADPDFTLNAIAAAEGGSETWRSVSHGWQQTTGYEAPALLFPLARLYEAFLICGSCL